MIIYLKVLDIKNKIYITILKFMFKRKVEKKNVLHFYN